MKRPFDKLISLLSANKIFEIIVPFFTISLSSAEHDGIDGDLFQSCVGKYLGLPRNEIEKMVEEASLILFPDILGVDHDAELNCEVVRRLTTFDFYRKAIFCVNKLAFLKGAKFNSATNSSALGCIFLSDKLSKINDVKIDLSIIHELAHHELFLLNLFDGLIEENYRENLQFSPLRDELRPPMPRLHALHAIFRMRQYSSHIGIDGKDLACKFELAVSNISTFELTPFGAKIFEFYQTWIF